MSSLLIFLAISGCVSDEERERVYYEAAHYSYLMVASGDSTGALRYLQRQVTKLPDAKTKQDSMYYANMVLRLAFLDYYADSTGALSLAYYEHAYPFLRHLPEPTRIDGLRWTALVLAQRGDTTSAILRLYESRHLALILRDSSRMAQVDTCLSYLVPRPFAAISKQAWPSDILLIGLLIFVSTLFGCAWAVKHHLDRKTPEPAPEPEAPGKPIRFPFEDPLST